MENYVMLPSDYDRSIKEKKKTHTSSTDVRL